MKYKLKPKEIEATQFNFPYEKNFEEQLKYSKDIGLITDGWERRTGIVVFRIDETISGCLSDGDYIVNDRGQRKVIRKRDFEENYEVCL